MKTTIRSAAVVTMAVLALAGCATPGKRTVLGGGAGAAVGAGVGGAVGDDKGALIGAGVGAVVGAAAGNYLDKRAQELEKVAETQKTERGLLVKLQNDVLFGFDSAALTPEAVEQVSKLGELLAKYPDDRILVEGHTDAVGPASYNESLSVRRARAVEELLQARGVRPGQLRAAGQGEQDPVASNATPDGRSRNRRVELHIDVKQPEQVASARR